tara:strand:- start:313 stop:516 length:204 start_codon:yes stop_codon:yes gene_type:complete
MIQYKLSYSDKSNIQYLEIEIINNNSFINDSYIIEEEESKEIYLLLISDNKKEIQDYLLELIQDRSY